MNKRVNPKGAAEILGLTAGTLAVWRCLGRGPRYKKIGGRVFYEIADLESFADLGTVETIDTMDMR